MCFYELPNYEPNEPNYNFYEAKITLLSYDDLPGIDLNLTDKIILRRLKTIALELEYKPSWSPESDSLFVDQPIYLDLLKEVFGEKQSHFIWHYDWCGYYVPVNFGNVPVPYDFLAYTGSSINLCNEIQEIAAKLKFNLGAYTPYLRTLAEQRFDELANDLFGVEKLMLLELYNIAVASVKYNLLISFA